jgi:hypothetical protein
MMLTKAIADSTAVRTRDPGDVDILLIIGGASRPVGSYRESAFERRVI